MKKKIRNIAAIIWVLAALLPIRVFAAGGDTFRLDGTGTVTLVSEHAAKEKISSLQFSLVVDGAASVDFQFSSSNAKVLEARYHEDTKILNIYLAGTKALFAENTDTLEIGTVLALDEEGNNASATVSVVADSLWYVYGNEQIQAQGLEIPDAVSIGPNNHTPGGSGGTENGGGNSSGNSGTGSGGTENGGGNSETGSDDGSGGTGSDDGNGGWNGNQGNQPGRDPGAPGIGNPGGDGQEDSSEEDEENKGGSKGSGSGNNRGKGQGGENQDSNASSEPDDAPLEPDTSDAGTVSETYKKLQETLENARKLSEEDYTPESFQVLQETIAQAQEVLEHPHVTEEELKEALLNLENAIGALEKITEAGPSRLEEEGREKGKGFLVAGVVLVVILLIAAAAFAVVTLHGKQSDPSKKGRASRRIKR